MSEEDQNIQSRPNSSEEATTSQDQNSAANNSAGQLDSFLHRKKMLGMLLSQSSTKSNKLADTSHSQVQATAGNHTFLANNKKLLQQVHKPLARKLRVSALSDLSVQLQNNSQSLQSSNAPSFYGPNPISSITSGGASNVCMMSDNDDLTCIEMIANFDEESEQPAGHDQDDFNGFEVALNDENENDDCPICLGPFKESGPIKATGACDHVFHAQCLEDSLKQDFKCPVCRAVIKKKLGPCPNGYMSIRANKNLHCAGYEKCGTIVIIYML